MLNDERLDEGHPGINPEPVQGTPADWPASESEAAPVPEPAEVEAKGATVIDRSREVEAQGVTAIDHSVQPEVQGVTVIDRGTAVEEQGVTAIDPTLREGR